MARMIDADKQEPIIEELENICMNNEYILELLAELKNQPTVDAKPVRYAKRIVVRSAERNRYDFYTYQVKCSECGDTEAYKNYCQNCGAKFISSNFVDEERENENAGG